MRTIVVDTSIVLAIFFQAPHATWAVEGLEIEEELLAGGIRFVAPDVDQARLAADARLRFPLNLGECFAYALARAEGCGILTLDADFGQLDGPVTMPPAQRR